MPYKNLADKREEQRRRRATPEGQAKRKLYRSRARGKVNPSVREVAEALATSVLAGREADKWTRAAEKARLDLARSTASMRR